MVNDVLAYGERRTGIGIKLTSFISGRNFYTCLISAIAVFILILTVTTSRADAYTVEKHDDPVSNQIVVSPAKVELDMRPGETRSIEVRISNRTGETITVDFSFEDFEGSSNPDQATVFLEGREGRWGASRWFTPEIDSVVLQHGDTVVMTVKTTVPPDAAPGGRYSSLFGSTIYKVRDEQGAIVNINTSVGCLFLIRVAGEMREDATLDNIEVPGFSEFGPIDFGMVLNNYGNVHLKATGRIIITNLLGQTVAEVPAGEWTTLPEASRRQLVQWDRRILFGRYTARAEIDYGTEGGMLTAETTFWVIPWKIIIGAAVVILVLLAILLIRKRRRSRAYFEPYPEEEEYQEWAETEPGFAEEMPADAIEGRGVSAGPAARGNLVALSDIFPSMEEAGLVDLDSADTQELIRELIDQHLDLARAEISAGDVESAKREIEEARVAAIRLGLRYEQEIIEELLHWF